MRVLVTGASGFIGRQLGATLVERGHEALAVPRAALAAPAPPDADAVVHLGFPTVAERRKQQPLQALEQALAGAAQAARLARSTRTRQLVLASSGKVYGTPRELPLGETHPREPTTLLGELKLLVEQALEVAARNGDIAVTSLRIFNAYGPQQRSEFLVPTLLAGFRSGQLVLGELDHRRDFVHVRDVCAAIVTCLERPAARGEHRPLNVGSGRSTSVRELVELLANALGKHLPITRDERRLRPHEPAEERADITRLVDLGWQPTLCLDAGIRALALEAHAAAEAEAPGKAL